MPTDTLTDAKARAAKPADKPRKLFDGGGLHLFVTPAGAKVWRMAYRLDGKQKTISFGPYPLLSLADARRRRDEVKRGLLDGTDPMAERKAKPKRTLRELCEGYWRGRQDITDGYKQDAIRCLEMHIYPELGNRVAAELTKADLMEPLEKMNAAGRYTYVRRARMWLSMALDHGVETGDVEVNTAAQIRPEKAFGKRKRKHFAAVDPRQVGDLMYRLSFEEQTLQSVLACRLMSYTWLRTTELRMLLWSEWPEHDMLCLPEGRMKRQRDHYVPLPRQAIAILQELKARSRGSRFIFPGGRSLDKPMSENAVLALLYRMGYKGAMTGHGWRSVGSTWANERGWNPDAVEMQLSHAEEDKTRSAYNRALYLDERRSMLQSWADWLDAQLGQVDTRGDQS